MRNSNRLSYAIHLLCYVYLRQDNKVSSNIIAKSVNVTPVTIRQITTDLRNAGLIQTKAGSGKITFLKKIEDISLLDIFEAVSDGELLNRNIHANLSCQIGKQIPAILDQTYCEIEEKTKQEMAKVSLRDIIGKITK